MRFSLWLWPYARWGGYGALGAAAKRAEELGFASVTVSDHTICTTGPESDGLTALWPDWSVLCTLVALSTTRIRIVASLVVPYRRLLPMAKQITTIDQVSNGRFTLAAAVGWLRPEFEMLRVPYEQRGAITDEYLRAMRVLWTEDEPRFSGEHISFSGIAFEPKCAQQPHVPIWVAGGSHPRVIRRVLEQSDGWMPMGSGLDDELRDTVARIKQGAADRGRDPGPLTFRYTIGVGRSNASLEALSKSISVGDPAALGHGGSPEEVAQEVEDFRSAGFNELAINFSGESAGELTEQMEWFGEQVMPLVSRPA